MNDLGYNQSFKIDLEDLEQLNQSRKEEYYDIIGHVLCQPCWTKGKTLDLCISETASRKKLKLGTQQGLLMENMCEFFMTS